MVFVMREVELGREVQRDLQPRRKRNTRAVGGALRHDRWRRRLALRAKNQRQRSPP
jgi:hypothetical protein